MLIQPRREIADRACAAIADSRAIDIQAALQVSPAAAWVLARMEADRNGVDAQEMQFDIVLENYPFFRRSDLIALLVEQIHDRIGKDSTFTSGGIIALTALGRLRILQALGEEII